MEAARGSIAAVVAHVDLVGATRASRRQVAGWGAVDPVLAVFGSAGEAARACRAGPPSRQDELIVALLRAVGEDKLAQLTVVAGLSRRLGAVVAGWARSGVLGAELAAMEADLVAECWAAVAEAARLQAARAGCRARPGLWLVDAAREAVRVPRRRLRRAVGRQVPLVEACHVVAPAGRPAADRLGFVVVDCVRRGALSPDDAGCVLLTRVAGWRIAELAARWGCTAAGLRARRMRAERRLRPA
jgi:hypothetical protein